ncbi:hypothetical protein OTU49_007049 [Cherax quadricarinatus]|uniref:Uncharacterized protein n=3 Tax=Cherax quadricarinatus TaxID=27406 RepID=A0AAW0WWG5_CHEQU
MTNASQSSRSTLSELCQELEALRLNVSLSPQCDTPSQDIISASSKFLASSRPKENKPGTNPKEVMKAVVEQEAAAQQMSYIIKSVDVATHRLAEIMADLAKDLQSNSVANLSMTRTVRTKLKPEILCLKNVVSKCCTNEEKKNIDFGFIHILLATKVTESVQQNLMPSDICVLAETMKIFVSRLNFLQLNSSDEEDTTKPVIINEEKHSNAEHCTCVLQCLDKALNMVYNNCATDVNITNKENMKLSLMRLGECTCSWNAPANVARSDDFRSTPISNTKYTKAFKFLHQTIFNESKNDVKKISQYEDCVKKLVFSEDEEEEVLTATLNVKDGVNVFQNVIKNVKKEDNEVEGETFSTDVEEILEKDGDSDSYATAASSVEDVMATPDEGVEVYINGLEASKVDADVLAAIGEGEVDEMKYPYVSQWYHLISSYSKVQRDSWPSPYCSRIHHSSAANTAPSKLLHHNTPLRHCNSWIPSSTSRVLFSKGFDQLGASPF